MTLRLERETISRKEQKKPYRRERRPLSAELCEKLCGTLRHYFMQFSGFDYGDAKSRKEAKNRKGKPTAEQIKTLPIFWIVSVPNSSSIFLAGPHHNKLPRAFIVFHLRDS